LTKSPRSCDSGKSILCEVNNMMKGETILEPFLHSQGFISKIEVTEKPKSSVETPMGIRNSTVNSFAVLK